MWLKSFLAYLQIVKAQKHFKIAHKDTLNGYSLILPNKQSNRLYSED